MRQRRITHNPALTATLPKIEKAAQPTWSGRDGAIPRPRRRRPPGTAFEVLIGCGLRRGEALALQWADVDLDLGTLVVRRTPSEVNGHLVFSDPKTRASAAGVGLPARVVAALRVQRMRQDMERDELGDAYADGDLVFARESGEPIWPDYMTKRLGPVCKAAGVPRIRIHDLRHTAATLMLGSGVPLPLVSKVLRHTQLSITAGPGSIYYQRRRAGRALKRRLARVVYALLQTAAARAAAA